MPALFHRSEKWRDFSSKKIVSFHLTLNQQYIHLLNVIKYLLCVLPILGSGNMLNEMGTISASQSLDSTGNIGNQIVAINVLQATIRRIQGTRITQNCMWEWW